MKQKILVPLLCTLLLLGTAAAAVFITGRIAEKNWQAPAESTAPVIKDTAAELVQTELKEYPYQILTLSAAQVLYKEIADAREFLTLRTDDTNAISAAEAAALTGGYAMTLYGSDLAEKTLDLLPVIYQNDGEEQYQKLWLAAYTLPDAAQTAPDGSAYTLTQGCWLFCLDAADGALLYSRCTALEGNADETAIEGTELLISDGEMLALYNRSLSLAETLGLTPTAFSAQEMLDEQRELVQTVFLTLDNDCICRLTFDKYYQTGNLYSIAVAQPHAFSQRPKDFEWVSLPLSPYNFAPKDLPSAITIAAQGDYSFVSKGQPVSSSAADSTAAYVTGYFHFDARDYLLYRFDPTTDKRSLLCTAKNCTHTSNAADCTAHLSNISDIFADDGNVYILPRGENEKRTTIEQVYPTARTVHSFTGDNSGHITSAIAFGDKIYATYRTGSDATQDDPLRYELYCIDTVSGKVEDLGIFLHNFLLTGRLGNYLLFSLYTRCNTVIETEAGLQPHDAGWRELLFALDTVENALYCVYDGRHDDYNTIEIENGRLWRAQLTPDGLHVIGQDLFTGKMLSSAPGFFLPVDSSSHCQVTGIQSVGNYLLVTLDLDSTNPYYLFDTTTGKVSQLPFAYQTASHIIAVFGEEALIQKVSGTEHKYFYLSLSALLEFECRVERRWVTDDFVIG